MPELRQAKSLNYYRSIALYCLEVKKILKMYYTVHSNGKRLPEKMVPDERIGCYIQRT